MSPVPPVGDAGRSRRPDRRSHADDQFAALQSWILGLPWVVSDRAPLDVPQHIVIDCEPLGLRRVWIVVACETDARETDLFVVVTSDLTPVAGELGWFTGIVPLDGGHSLCRLDLELGSEELEMVLLATYGMIFSTFGDGGDAAP